ncbi:hypothetical protein GCM10009744_06150 [Kribbella alba]|uniref:Uncharacterized protein n=1 Tax=Kribbella alba TaxID=190197 RepID=A0ABN2EXW2_9ACTN
MTLLAPSPAAARSTAAASTADAAPAYLAPEPAERVLTVFTAEVVETRGMLARIAVLLNPYDVRELKLCLETCTLRVVVEGAGFDAGRVAARLDKVIGVLDVTYS